MVKQLRILVPATLLLLSFQLSSFQLFAAPTADKYLWLENIQDKKALQWVEKQNSKTEKRLVSDARYEPIRKYLLDVYNDPDALARGRIVGDKVYNFWTDAKNARGLLRATSLEAYRTGKPQWETVLDIDELSKREKKSWYYGSTLYGPGTGDRALLLLSGAGGDATTVREFDLRSKTFVKDGFFVSEAKNVVSWFDRDHILIATDEGKGSLNLSGYPVVLRLLKRGQKIKDAPVVYRANPADNGGGVLVWTEFSRGGEVTSVGVGDSRTFYDVDYFVLDLKAPLDATRRVTMPFLRKSQYVGRYKGDHILVLPEAWPEQKVKAGSVVALTEIAQKPGSFLITVLYESEKDLIVEGASISDDYLYVDILKNVQKSLDRLEKVGGKYRRVPLKLPKDLQVSVILGRSDHVQYSSKNFLTPTSLHVQLESERKLSPALYRSKSRFDESRFETRQFHATSADGTRIPYFVVQAKKRDSKLGLPPARIYAYGGFGVTYTPSYLEARGKVWLQDAQGISVLANIRGGGEFGDAWHESALDVKRHKAFEDLIAVGEDLVKRKLADPKRIGIEGGSNGGLLTSAVAMLRPDLFTAVVSAVPLTDMHRFDKLLAGASWIAEYGNPADPKVREFWSRYGPYQNVKVEAKYPEILFLTSTADDRVHPGHARKMTAKLEELGHSVLLFENREGGHGGSADAEQAAKIGALRAVYQLQKLVDPK